MLSFLWYDKGSWEIKGEICGLDPWSSKGLLKGSSWLLEEPQDLYSHCSVSQSCSCGCFVLQFEASRYAACQHKLPCLTSVIFATGTVYTAETQIHFSFHFFSWSISNITEMSALNIRCQHLVTVRRLQHRLTDWKFNASFAPLEPTVAVPAVFQPEWMFLGIRWSKILAASCQLTYMTFLSIATEDTALIVSLNQTAVIYGSSMP